MLRESIKYLNKEYLNNKDECFPFLSLLGEQREEQTRGVR